jgi:hypothetical protein
MLLNLAGPLFLAYQVGGGRMTQWEDVGSVIQGIFDGRQHTRYRHYAAPFEIGIQTHRDEFLVRSHTESLQWS